MVHVTKNVIHTLTAWLRIVVELNENHYRDDDIDVAIYHLQTDIEVFLIRLFNPLTIPVTNLSRRHIWAMLEKNL